MKLLPSQEQELVAIALFYADRDCALEAGYVKPKWELVDELDRNYWRRRATQNRLPDNEHDTRETISTFLDNIT
jgi:hypothetical protein